MFNKIVTYYVVHKNELEFLSFCGKIILFILVIWIGFFRDKTYYEDISLEYTSLQEAPDFTRKNLANYLTIIDSNTLNKSLFITSDSEELSVIVYQYKSGDGINEKSYKISDYQETIIPPGNTLQINYFENGGIPNYAIKFETKHGSTFMPLAYNGKMGAVNRKKIKSTKKLVPYLIDKMLK